MTLEVVVKKTGNQACFNCGQELKTRPIPGRARCDNCGQEYGSLKYLFGGTYDQLIDSVRENIIASKEEKKFTSRWANEFVSKISQFYVVKNIGMTRKRLTPCAKCHSKIESRYLLSLMMTYGGKTRYLHLSCGRELGLTFENPEES